VRPATDFLRGFSHFVVGDDWPTFFGVVAALTATAVLAAVDIAAWWLMPVAIIVLLRWSLLRRTRVISHGKP
jgi:hypothetical protein